MLNKKKNKKKMTKCELPNPSKIEFHHQSRLKTPATNKKKNNVK